MVLIKFFHPVILVITTDYGRAKTSRRVHASSSVNPLQFPYNFIIDLSQCKLLLTAAKLSTTTKRPILNETESNLSEFRTSQEAQMAKFIIVLSKISTHRPLICKQKW